MPNDTFYETLDVSPELEPEAIRSHANDNIDSFRSRIEDAEDSGSERRRLILAFEVLTDPEERYLYELFGHERYVDTRLKADEIDTIAGDSLTAAFTPGTGGTDTQIFDPATDVSTSEIFEGGGTIEADLAGARSDPETIGESGPDGTDVEAPTDGVEDEGFNSDDFDATETTRLREEGDGLNGSDNRDADEIESETTRIEDDGDAPANIESEATRIEGAETGPRDVESGETRIEDEGNSPVEVDTDTTRIQNDAETLRGYDETELIDDESTDDSKSDDYGDKEDDANSDTESDGSLAEVSRDDTLVEKLSEFPVSSSPLSGLPGIRSEQYRNVVITAYALAGLASIGLVGVALPYGSAQFGVLAAFGLLVGATVTYATGALRYHRELSYRAAVGVGACLPLLMVATVVAGTTTPAAVLSLGTFAAGLLGVTAGNTYIESTRQTVREQRKADDGRGGRNYVETDPTAGEETRDVDGDDLLERFSADHSGRTGAVAADFGDEAVVHATRGIVPERHIMRRLMVKDERTDREVPVSQFASGDSTLRTDVDSRDENHPEEFTAETYTYLISQSVEEITCPKCSGATRVSCPTCSGGGQVICKQCGGRTQNTCGRCAGSGQVETNSGYRTCGNCGGQGHTPCGRCGATGSEVCGRCRGSGDVVCNRCEGDGRVTTYTTLTREYTPETDVEYQDQSVPISEISDAEGVQIHRERQRNTAPDAVGGDVFMKEYEIREIPTSVLTYEYAGDLWELYEIEGAVSAPSYPRELSARVKLLAASNAVAVGFFTYVGVLGPAGLP